MPMAGAAGTGTGDPTDVLTLAIQLCFVILLLLSICNAS